MRWPGLGATSLPGIALLLLLSGAADAQFVLAEARIVSCMPSTLESLAPLSRRLRKEPEPRAAKFVTENPGAILEIIHVRSRVFSGGGDDLLSAEPMRVGDWIREGSTRRVFFPYPSRDVCGHFPKGRIRYLRVGGGGNGLCDTGEMSVGCGFDPGTLAYEVQHGDFQYLPEDWAAGAPAEDFFRLYMDGILEPPDKAKPIKDALARTLPR